MVEVNFWNYIKESKNDKNKTLFEVILKIKEGETVSKFIWANDAGEALDIFKERNKPFKGEGIQVITVKNEDIYKMREKSEKKIEDLKNKMRKLASEYSKYKKILEEEEEFFNSINLI